MKKILAGGALALTMGAATLIANAADQAVDLTATVTGFCEITAANPLGSPVNMTSNSLGTASSSYTIDNPVNANGVLAAASFDVRLTATCNAPTTGTLTSLSGGLKDPTPVPIEPGSAAAFRNVINYTAQISGPNGLNASLTTNGTPNDTSTGTATNAFNGDILVSFDIVTAGATEIVTAGDYADVLTISLTPN